jgi:hypothetical protein
LERKVLTKKNKNCPLLFYIIAHYIISDNNCILRMESNGSTNKTLLFDIMQKLMQSYYSFLKTDAPYKTTTVIDDGSIPIATKTSPFDTLKKLNGSLNPKFPKYFCFVGDRTVLGDNDEYENEKQIKYEKRNNPLGVVSSYDLATSSKIETFNHLTALLAKRQQMGMGYNTFRYKGTIFLGPGQTLRGVDEDVLLSCSRVMFSDVDSEKSYIAIAYLSDIFPRTSTLMVFAPKDQGLAVANQAQTRWKNIISERKIERIYPLNMLLTTEGEIDDWFVKESDFDHFLAPFLSVTRYLIHPEAYSPIIETEETRIKFERTMLDYDVDKANRIKDDLDLLPKSTDGAPKDESTKDLIRWTRAIMLVDAVPYYRHDASKVSPEPRRPPLSVDKIKELWHTRGSRKGKDRVGK